MVPEPTGNGYDIPTPPRVAPAPAGQAPASGVSERFQRQTLFAPPIDQGPRPDRLGYERGDGEQDPLGVQPRRAESGGRPRRRSDALFAALMVCGLAASAGAAMMFSGREQAQLASAPVSFDAPAPAAADAAVATAAAAPVMNTPEPMRVHSVSLTEALGDPSKAKNEPARSKAGMDKGVDRRR